MNVSIFIPCFIDQLHPTVGMNMVKVLRHVGCKVDYNPDQTCCGQPAFNAGFWDDAKKVGAKFIDDFEGSTYIVAPSASCVGFVKNYYKELFANTPDHNRVKDLQSKIFELSDFLVNVLKIDNTGSTWEGTATYHDSCAALRECKISDEPRKLLKNVKGLKLIEMQQNTVCCGFGGTFAVKFEPIAVGMADDKVNNALATEADYMISTDQSCLMHLQAYITKQNKPLKTIHLADVLASGL
jgi:L-lactate dehydrogenase complex protein LldE